MRKRPLLFSLALLGLACADDTGGNDIDTDAADETAGSGDGDGDAEGNQEAGDGDAESGDGDGDTDAGDGDGDTGDDDGDTGDGDGDTGDGDGDTGDGDGDTGDGDGDTGDGDGDTGDGDGDGDTGDGDGDGDGDEDCPLAAALVPCDADSDDPMHAIGLNCPDGEPTSIPITNASFNAPANNSWRVAKQFGSSGDWSAHEGEKLLVITTGVLPPPNANGAVILSPGVAQGGDSNANPDFVTSLPGPINPVNGSGGTPFQDCDLVNDCSDTLQAQWQLGGGEANDLLWFSFDLAVPAQANGFKFDFAFFSAEYPEWVDTQYNDVFLVWSTSETYTGNITFINDQPLTITALANSIAYEGNAPELAGTGVDGMDIFAFPPEPNGGGTGWFTATASAAPSEDLTLAWAIFDMGDTVYDTTVLIDAFRWDCEGCIPSEVNSCGVQPQ